MGVLAGVTNGVIGIFMTAALIGYFYVRLDKPNRLAESLGQASYWVYLIHFPVVIAAAGLVVVVDMPAIFKYLATLTIAIPLIALSYYVLVLGTPLKYAIVGKTR
jgi:peptidoglycan/LPS O-acetylase OafA/YrhL